MTSRIRLVGASVGALLVIAAFAFYLSTRGPVYGEIACRVTQGGKPLDQVEIIFCPDGDGPRSCGVSDASGFCAARTDALVGSKDRVGAPVGTCKVVMIDRREALREQHARLHFVPTTSGVMGTPSNAAAGAATKNTQKLPIRIPDTYNRRSVTPLTGIEIRPGRNEFEFEVKPGSMAAAKN